MTVFISAGEASGDAYGAALVEEMRRLAVDPLGIEVLANGGKRLAAVCDHLIADTSGWGAISIAQALKVAPRILAQVPTIAARVRRHEANALAIPIDFGFFNARFARRAKAQGWKILAFVPPGSWRRDRQAKWAPAIYDAVSTPFKWSAELLTKMGTPNVHWFGHPLKQLVRARMAAYSQGPRLEQIALLPGSRKHELALNLPLMAASLPDLPGEFALATGTDAAAFMRRWKALAPNRNDKVTVGDSAAVLLRSRAAVVCSGTATLEAALCRCPMTVVYSVSFAMCVEAVLLRLKRPKFVALPNILLDRMLVDELVGIDAHAHKVRPSLAALVPDGPVRQRQLDGFDELDAQLGPDDAITQTARLVLDMLGVPAA
ncbi:MAG: lipid-A-disaccharide synthase [Fimbriimonadaceae bacterium]